MSPTCRKGGGGSCPARQFYWSWILAFLFMLLMAFGFSSCKGRQILPSGEDSIVLVDSRADFLRCVASRQPNFHSMTMKFRATNFSNRQEIHFTGVSRIVRDSAVWLTLSPGLGIELVRVLLRPDSLFFMNKIQQSYFAGDYAYFQQVYGLAIDYRNLEALLTGVVAEYPALRDAEKPFSRYLFMSEDSSQVLRSYTDEQLLTAIRDGMIGHRYEFQDCWPRSMELKDYQNAKVLSVLYGLPTEVDGIPFVSGLTLTTRDRDGESRTELEVLRLELDRGLTFPFEIPSHYQPIVRP